MTRALTKKEPNAATPRLPRLTHVLFSMLPGTGPTPAPALEESDTNMVEIEEKTERVNGTDDNSFELDERRQQIHVAPPFHHSAWLRAAGFVVAIVHQVVFLGLTSAIVMSKSASSIVLVLGIQLAIYGLYVAHGNNCILTLLERRLHGDSDHLDRISSCLIPGYDPQKQRSMLGVGLILSGVYMCVIKLFLITAFTLMRRIRSSAALRQLCERTLLSLLGRQSLAP